MRRLLWRAYWKLSVTKPAAPLPDMVPPLPRQDEIRSFITSLDMPDDCARRYLEIHLDRIAITLSLVPPPRKTGKVLELGSYMHTPPTLRRIHGYSEVRGAYFGTLGKSELKQSSIAGKPFFECYVDLFNAEKDRYPYQDSTFDCVLACEIFEHFLHDPMHMLAEANRILDSGGYLILTTPNAVSATAVARSLQMSENPQVYSKYTDPRKAGAESEVGHMREYTPNELAQVLQAAGFEIEHLFTKSPPGYRSHEWVLNLLLDLRYPIHLRGEQMYCVARKATAVQERYPRFLYE
jgi:SAM-dependent methyltransferase